MQQTHEYNFSFSSLLVRQNIGILGLHLAMSNYNSFFCISKTAISISLRISWRAMPKPCGFFKIQDGRHDGRRITKIAVTLLIIDLKSQIWCLLVGFGWQGICLCGLFDGWM